MLQENSVVNSFSKRCLLLVAVKKAPAGSLNSIAINDLSTKEFETFSNVSVFVVHTENGSFSKRTISNLFVFVGVFEKLRFHSGAV